MPIVHLFISLLFISGFYFIGKKISKITNTLVIIKKISQPNLQYTTIGIAYFTFISFPLLFLGLYDELFFKLTSSLILILGFINIIFNIQKIKIYLENIFSILKKIDTYNYLIFSFLLFYFLLSISPITSADSVAYHLGSAKYILENGRLPTDLWNPNNLFVGAGELIYAFALSVNAFQFTTLINFAGLISIIGLCEKFSINFKLNKNNKQILFLLILSCPVLVFLISSSKSQLFSISLVLIGYSILINYLKNNLDKKLLIKILVLLNIILIVSIQTKISFMLSSFIILSIFHLLHIKKTNFLKLLLISVILFCFGLFPAAVWKQTIYEYPFYNFLINPIPLNIPGYLDVYLFAKEYLSEKFPISIFLPLSLSDLTQFIGIGCLILIYLLKFDFENKKILLISVFGFIITMIFLGQKTPRFFLEIYFLTILLFAMIINIVARTKYYKIFKIGIILQSCFVLLILIFGVSILFPGNISEKMKKRILSKYASGYNLYSWANNVLPDDSVTLIYHRSYYFAEKNILYFGIPVFTGNSDINSRKYHLNKVKQKKPNYILFYGYDENFNFDKFNFEDCISELFLMEKNVGFHETRNIFNSNKNYYNGYIYKLDTKKFPNCVKLD